MTFEEQVSYTDNSHIMGVPFIVREELHGYARMPRRDIRAFVEATSRQGVDFHVVYVPEVAAQMGE